MRRVSQDQEFEARRLLVFYEDEVRQVVEALCEYVATQWARKRPLPRTVKDLSIELIASRCDGDPGLVRWVAGILLRSGRLPLVGSLRLLAAGGVKAAEKWIRMNRSDERFMTIVRLHKEAVPAFKAAGRIIRDGP
jgi:hypothetical protein